MPFVTQYRHYLNIQAWSTWFCRWKTFANPVVASKWLDSSISWCMWLTACNLIMYCGAMWLCGTGAVVPGLWFSCFTRGRGEGRFKSLKIHVSELALTHWDLSVVVPESEWSISRNGRFSYMTHWHPDHFKPQLQLMESHWSGSFWPHFPWV